MIGIVGHDGMWKTQSINGKKIIGLCGYSKQLLAPSAC